MSFPIFSAIQDGLSAIETALGNLTAIKTSLDGITALSGPAGPAGADGLTDLIFELVLTSSWSNPAVQVNFGRNGTTAPYTVPFLMEFWFCGHVSGTQTNGSMVVLCNPRSGDTYQFSIISASAGFSITTVSATNTVGQVKLSAPAATYTTHAMRVTALVPLPASSLYNAITGAYLV